MANHAHAAPAALGGKLWTPVTVTLAGLVLLALAILLVRFLTGLGSVTNINDGYPWGIWVVYDVIIGSALACGGYTMAALVYLFNRGEYHALVRPALLASLFGYTLAGAGVIFDLGRYWNTWHIFWPGYAQPGSVMFEVAVCITLYIGVMWLEFSPTFFEKFNRPDLRKKVDGAMFAIIGLGILLPSMHQSSLGSLLVIMGYQIHPLWQTILLPAIFLMTAVLLGFAVVIFEACLSSAGFRRPMETKILSRLSMVMFWWAVLYLVVRVGDLVVRGALGTAFAFDIEALMFWVEMACFIAGTALMASENNRRQPAKLFLAAFAMLLGGFFLRINAFLVGYETGPGWHYFPSVTEMLVTIGMIALEILGYIIFVRALPVLPRDEGAMN